MKLNLGCGIKKLPGFVNIDIREEVEPDVIDDITTLKTVKKESVDLIYACHVLEHIEWDKTTDVLFRWYNVLQPNGILRLSVPDMDAVFAHYFYWKSLVEIKGFLWGGQDTKYDFHKSGWDFDLLSSILKAVGFQNVKRWYWENTSPHNYIDDYSQIYWPSKNCHYSSNEHPYADGKLMSLNIEGQKPNV